MKMMNTLILVLLIGSLGLVQQATSQDVEIRGAGDAQADLDGSASGAGGGQSRTIYSPRHLSPHRMMHFGKRPANIPPPTLREVYDLYPVQQQQQHQVRQQQLQRRSAATTSGGSNYLPFQFSLLLDNGQTLRAVPEDTLIPQPAASFVYPIMNRNLQYSYEPAHNQLTFAPFNEVADEQGRQQQQQQQLMMRQLFNGQLDQRLSKLVENDESKSSNSEPSSGSGEVSSENSSPERASDSNQQQQQQPQQQQQDSININTRSMHPTGRANTLSLPKAYFSSLFGRQGSASMPSYSNYNKKAEPKENFFMHFGRK